VLRVLCGKILLVRHSQREEKGEGMAKGDHGEILHSRLKKVWYKYTALASETRKKIEETSWARS
jgi:hypothetical protein